MIQKGIWKNAQAQGKREETMWEITPSKSEVHQQRASKKEKEEDP